MTNEVAHIKPKTPVAQFKADLAALKSAGEMDMLPSTVSYEAFRNAAVVAVTDNPEILKCSRESIFKSVRRLAAAGLVPDGREAAIVPYRGQAQAMPMVGGLIKVARNSGEIVSIWADVVYEGEDLRVWIEAGERKFDHATNPLTRGGKVVGAYAVAKLRDGTIEFEPMGREQIEKRRKVSATQKGNEPSGVWGQWYEEMAKKTVIRALCKRLPLSAQDRRIFDEDAAGDDLIERDVTPYNTAAPKRGGVVYADPDPEPEPITGEIMDAEDAETPDPNPSDADLEAAMDAAKAEAQRMAEEGLFQTTKGPQGIS